VIWYKEGTKKMLADPLTKLMAANVLYEVGILVDGQDQ
jgi:hypothetical protein